eukprot:1121029-Heterocapsa_arctica.AAC.1
MAGNGAREGEEAPPQMFLVVFLGGGDVRGSGHKSGRGGLPQGKRGKPRTWPLCAPHPDRLKPGRRSEGGARPTLRAE